MKGITSILAVLALALLLPACAQNAGESETAKAPVQEEETSDSPDDDVKAAIVASLESMENTVDVTNPTSQEVVQLTLDFVHDGVNPTPGGRYAVCVDFKSEDGSQYDLDYFVRMEEGGYVVAEYALHKVDGEDVMAAEEKERLQNQE